MSLCKRLKMVADTGGLIKMAGDFTLINSLAPSPTTITLSPLASVMPDHSVAMGAVIKTGIFGKTFAYTSYPAGKKNHRFEFNNVPKADADVVNGWSQMKTVLTYTESGLPSVTVIIINDGNPFDWMPNTPADSKFQGSLMLREI